MPVMERLITLPEERCGGRWLVPVLAQRARGISAHGAI